MIPSSPSNSPFLTPRSSPFYPLSSNSYLQQLPHQQNKLLQHRLLPSLQQSVLKQKILMHRKLLPFQIPLSY